MFKSNTFTNRSTLETAARIIVVVFALALIASACTTAEPSNTTTTSTPVDVTNVTLGTFPPVQGVNAALLTVAPSCDALLQEIQTQALARVTPWGLDGGGNRFYALDMEQTMDVVGEAAPATRENGAVSDSGSGSSSKDYSETNVQEKGVDEADIVKTDGEYIYSISGTQLNIIDPETLEILSRIELAGWGSQMLLDGDLLYVFSNGGGHLYIEHYGELPVEEQGISLEETMPAPYQHQGATVTLFDVSNPNTPKILETFTTDGSYLSARLNGSSIRMITTGAQPALEFTYPETNGLRGERLALNHNKEVIENSTLEDWVPYFVRYNATDKTEDEGVLLQCGDVFLPPTYSGFSFTSVLTFTPDTGLSPDAIGVMTTSNNVYATPASLYLATQQWENNLDQLFAEGDIDMNTYVEQMRTQLHRFTLTPNSTEYVTSTSVEGTLLSQWSMSEYENVLRVATTSEPQWGGWSEERESSSQVVTFDVTGNKFEELGRVEDLGVTERIYAVRYMDDIAYVVTFRQTDPLYVLDLSNPANPQMVGELKIPGYSAYLHPFDDTHLIGIGQDADMEGRTIGLQMSLFDVSDPSDPLQVDKITFSDANSAAEFDPHAFLQWGDRIFVPMQRWNDTWEKNQPIYTYRSGILVTDVNAEKESLHIAGGVTHDRQQTQGDYWVPTPYRSMVIGDVLYTFSDAGILASDLETLQELAWTSLQF